ncbi:MAG: GAF domain-containing protein [Acidobacteriota bacterium]|nr:MAG: GAF domain-containing protein [Acidobacteriota bacterium]
MAKKAEKRETSKKAATGRGGPLARVLQSENERLRALLETAHSLTSTLALDEVLDRAMSAAERFLRAESSSIWQIDEAKGELYFRLVHLKTAPADEVKQIRLKIGEGIVGWVALHGEPAIVNDVQKDPRWSAAVDAKADFETRSILSAPLRVRDRLVGVIQMVNKIGADAFSEDDLRDLTVLADLVAIALENARLYEEQRETFVGTATALALAIESRDKYTGGHTKRVLDFAYAAGRRLGLEGEELENLKLSAILHDIGKIGIPDNVLNKPGSLTEEEFKVMKRHPKIGGTIMSKIPFLENILDGMRYHHETLDGKGYPYGLRGEDIPLQARIVAVADAFDAMTSNRPYHDGRPVAEAVAELRRCSGTQFDADAVEALAAALEAGEVDLAPPPSDDPGEADE